LQIRYTENSAIAKKLREIFISSYKYLQVEKAKLINHRIPIKLPEICKEYLVLYTTEFQNTFLLDSITAQENKIFNKAILEISEEEFELDINYNRIDKTATIEQKQQLVKIRKLDKSICDNLKLLYKFNCQICGDDFGKTYDTIIIEAHHIESFTISMNNDSTNILVICPNHHRVIHKTSPFFDLKNLVFIYPNGLKECLKLNYHI